MPLSYGSARNPLDTRPSSTTGTMAQWKSWVDGLTRAERDRLYPGMHIDLIPAYEKIVGMEAQSGADTGFGMPAAFSPAGAAARPKPVSPFGPPTPQMSSAQLSSPLPGLLDRSYIGAPGLKASGSGLSAPGSSSPFAPAAFGFTPNMLNTPFGSPAPASTGFGTGAAPQQHPSALGSTPTFGLASFASSFATPALPGNPSGQPSQYARGILPNLDSGLGSPAGGTGPDFDRLKDTIDGLLGRKPKRREESKAEKILDDANEQIEHFREATAPAIEAARDIKDKAMRLAYEEVVQVFIDFWDYYNAASDEERQEVHLQLAFIAFEMIPGVGNVVGLARGVNGLRQEENQTAGNIIADILLYAIPVLGGVGIAIKFWRRFKRISKLRPRGARSATQVVKVWAKDEVRVMARDAVLALAEELAAQIIANGYSYKNWDAADLGISVVSGAATGAIGQMPNTTIAAWSDVTNAMMTAFAKQTIPAGGSLKDIVTTTEKAGWKTILMGLTTMGLLWLLKKFEVPRHYHDPIKVTVNIAIDKFWDYMLDLWYSSSE